MITVQSTAAQLGPVMVKRTRASIAVKPVTTAAVPGTASRGGALRNTTNMH